MLGIFSVDEQVQPGSISCIPYDQLIAIHLASLIAFYFNSLGQTHCKGKKSGFFWFFFSPVLLLLYSKASACYWSPLLMAEFNI